MPRPVLLAVGAGLLLAALVLGLTSQPAAAQPTPTSPSTTVAPPASPPPTLVPPPSVPPPAPAPGPGLFDVGGRVREAINGLVRELAARAVGPAVELAARSVLATPDLTAPTGRVAELWRLSAGLANSAYVLLITAGGVLLLANESLQTRYAVKDVAPRLVVGMVAANTSLWLASWGIELANALSRALLGPGVTPAQAEATLRTVLVFPLDNADVLLLLAVLVVVQCRSSECRSWAALARLIRRHRCHTWRWMVRVATPARSSDTRLTASWMAAPRHSSQRPTAAATPTLAAAGTVVTEISTPTSTLDLVVVRDSIPATPASRATSTEYRLGWEMNAVSGPGPWR
jgi:hypothetical protein